MLQRNDNDVVITINNKTIINSKHVAISKQAHNDNIKIKTQHNTATITNNVTVTQHNVLK